MIERIIIVDSVDPVVFYGVNNANIQLIRNLFPKLRIAARGSIIKVIGDDAETSLFEEKIKKLEEYCVKYNKLPQEVIIDMVRGEAPQEVKLKTYVAIALAVRALKSRQVKKIILSRPAVEAGEKLGFLPGDMKEKIDPYLQPLYDALEDMIPAIKLKEYMESNVIQIAPLAFMRGRTLSDAVIVLDEAQNTTTHQIKMFMTRLGLGSKMIITGDITQIDLPRTVTSGLIQALGILKGIPGIGRVEFDRKDIVRHKLVQRIVEAYQNFDDERRAAAVAARKEGEDIKQENESHNHNL